MHTYRDEVEDFLKNKIYMVVMVVVAVMCYGYSAANTTLSIDDLHGDEYVGSGNIMLSAGRFGMVFWSKILGINDYAPPYTFAIEVLAVIFLIWAAINFCILFKRVSNYKITKESMLVFSAMLVSFPLMNEIWEYSGANVFICGGYLFVSLSMLLLHKIATTKKINYAYILAALFMMIIVASSYESVVVIYVFIVTAILLLQEMYDNKKLTWKSLLGQIGVYVGFLVATILGRVIVGKCILAICELEKGTNGATGILWGSAGVSEIWGNLKKAIINDYVIRAIVYFPLAEVLVACAILALLLLYVIIKKKSAKAILPVAGMYASLVLLSLLQGSVTPYRACQIFGMFVAFVAMLLVNIFAQKKLVSKILLLGFMMLIIQQSMYLSYFLNLNHLRSEEETTLIKEIGRDLQTYGTDKPVVFLGEYSLSYFIKEAASVPKESKAWSLYAKVYAKYNNVPYQEVFEEGNRKIVSTNIKSMINWASEPTGGQFELRKIFNYFGYNYKMLENAEQMLNAFYTACESVAYYWDNIGELAWKGNYAILETDDYIIVHLR